jgi:MFS family permease
MIDSVKSSGREAGRSAAGALAALSLCTLMAALGTSIANVALPTLAEAFQVPYQDVQWVVLAYLLTLTELILAAGALGDRLGRRRLLASGLALYTAASIVCGIAPALWLLVLGRAAQGAGAAVMMALAMAFVGESVGRAKTGRAMGLLGTMSALGTALGPALGGLLISALGWRAIFLLNVPLGIAALYLARRCLPARPAPKAPSRPIRLAAFRDPLLRAGLAANVLVMAVMMATLIVGPFYLAGTLGLDAVRVGLVVSLGPLVVALAGVPAGALADRFGAPRMTVAGLAAMTAGCLLLSLLPAAFGVAGYAGPLVVITAGYALFQTANNTAVMVDVPSDQRGAVSALLNLSRNLGLIAGASVMGNIFALAGMRTTFAVGAALAAAALAMCEQLDGNRRRGGVISRADP